VIRINGFRLLSFYMHIT